MFKIKLNIIFILMFLFVSKIQAQDDNFITDDENTTESDRSLKDNKFAERLVKGGNFYINFWGDVFEINVNPILGYKVNEDFLVGVGMFIDYQNSNYYQFSSTILGGKVFARYFIYNNLFTQAEFEKLRISLKYNYNSNANVYFYDGLYVGLGYNFGEYRNSGVTIMVLYDLLYNEENSIYQSPISLRVGLNF